MITLKQTKVSCGRKWQYITLEIDLDGFEPTQYYAADHLRFRNGKYTLLLKGPISPEVRRKWEEMHEKEFSRAEMRRELRKINA